MSTRPDIVLLVLDTQRADRLSCYGYPQPTTPHLDAFAADATRFSHAFSAAQWTVPTHTSLFTGLYPSVHGTQQSFSVVPESLPLLAERLGDDGYYTAAFCNNPLVGVVNNGLRRGFYSFLNYSGWLTNRPNQAGRPVTLFGRYRQLFKRMLGGVLHQMQDAFARSDALLDFAFTPLMVPFWQTALSFKGNTAKSLNDAARLLIRRKETLPDQPIFTFINLMGTHMPFHPPRPYIERFAPELLRNKANQRYLQRFNGDVFGWLAPLSSSLTDEHKALLDGMYNAEVAAQDEQIGQFFGKLRSSGALDRTLVMVVADHGEHLGEKHLLGHTVSLYNVLTHVPLIVRDPSGALPIGQVVEQNVSTRRVCQTALTAAGLASETEAAYALHNLGANDPDQGTVFAEAQTPQNVLNLMIKHKPDLVQAHRTDQKRRAVWRDQYKLIQTGPDQLELYDFLADPQEMTNLAGSQPEVARELRETLRTFERDAEKAAVASDQVLKQDDPQLNRRLRALGYLE
ncbi:MAG: sulfatase-like hydrolase/transferase [Caldilineaceae bacterium]|nr:sulfatase-like hydrolase/transferase [Caldilineaceae bacterium]